MLKADVLAKLEKYKDSPVLIGLSDEGQVLYSGFKGHWLFVQGDNLVYIKKTSTEGVYGVGGITQQQHPFSLTVVPFDAVEYVKCFLPYGAGVIASALEGLSPVGTSKTLAEIESEIESDDVLKALSPRGNLNVDDVAPGGSYGPFRGSAISTEIGGLPKYMDDIVTEG